jgi:tetratricopeptide (TPR) repeat protein
MKHPAVLLTIVLIAVLFSITGKAHPLRTHQNLQLDSVTIKRLLETGLSLELTDPEQTIYNYRKALSIAEKIGYPEIARIYNTLGWYYNTQSKYDSATSFFKQALLTVPDHDIKETITAYRGLGQTRIRLSAQDSARFYFNIALQLAEKFNSYKQQAEIHNGLGNSYIEENNFEKALEEYFTGATLYDSLLHDPIGYSTSLLNIGNVHFVLGNLEKALTYSRQGSKLAEDNNNFNGIAYSHKLLGRIYRKLHKTDSAIIEYNVALKTYLQRGDKQSAAEIELSLGNIHYDILQYRTALSHLSKATALARAIHGASELAYIYSSSGFSYYALKQHDLAILYFDSSRLYARKINNPYLVMDAYSVLGEIEKENKNFQRALEYNELLSALKDSIAISENRKAVEELNLKYESEKKQAAINLLQRDQRISRFSTYALFGVLLFVIMIAFFVINRSRLKLEVEKKIGEKERELGLQQKELYESELKTKQLQQERLKQEIEFKNKELTTYTLNLIQKNEILEELKTILQQLDKTNDPGQLNNILKKLKYSAQLDKEWDGFKRYFEQVHTGFFDSLLNQYPELTAADLKLCALLKLNLESKEIATLLGISPESVKVSRSRLRKKLSLDLEQNLTIFLTARK